MTRYQISRTLARRPNTSQQGVALVVGLVMLLVMTLLAVSSMNMSNLQFLMAGNTQQQTHALVRGENALLFGQNDIVTTINSQADPAPTAAGSGYYIYNKTTATSGIDVTSDTAWNTSTNYRTTTGESSERYIIEYIDNRPALDGSLSGGSTPAPTRNLYRLTARGLSDKGARRTLQTIVVTEQAPP